MLYICYRKQEHCGKTASIKIHYCTLWQVDECLCLPSSKVETEGRIELQQARKRVAGEVEGLLRYLEGNANHPSRLAIEELSREAQSLLLAGVVAPFRQGQAQEASETAEELVEAVQDVAMRLAQVKTGGSVPLRKARYRALTRVCAVQEVLEGRVRIHTLALPLSDETHEAVQRINHVMVQVSNLLSELYSFICDFKNICWPLKIHKHIL